MPRLLQFIPFFLLIDVWQLQIAKGVLIQFLTGIVNRKNWYIFHRKQKWTDRLTLNYIEPLLKKHKREFRFLHCLYQIVLYTAIPHAVLLGLLSLIISADSATRTVFCLLLLPRIVFAVIFRLQCDGGGASSLKCVQKKRRP